MITQDFSFLIFLTEKLLMLVFLLSFEHVIKIFGKFKNDIH